jgi:hypothetical protein
LPGKCRSRAPLWQERTELSRRAIPGYIMVCAILSLIAAALMKDYTGNDIAAEYA